MVLLCQLPVGLLNFGNIGTSGDAQNLVEVSAGIPCRHEKGGGGRRSASTTTTTDDDFAVALEN